MPIEVELSEGVDSVLPVRFGDELPEKELSAVRDLIFFDLALSFFFSREKYFFCKYADGVSLNHACCSGFEIKSDTCSREEKGWDGLYA